MALYLKFLNVVKDEIDFVRFRSAIKFFNTLSSNLRFTELKIHMYYGDPFDESFELKDYDFGLLESYFRNQLSKLSNKSSRLGLVIEGKINIDDKYFYFSYDLMPRVLCFKEGFDIRLEILPNDYAEIFEDLIKLKSDLQLILHNRIKEYNNMKDNYQYNIKRAVLSKHGGEYEKIDEWDFLFSIEEQFFLNKIIDSNEELRNRLSFGNKSKFSHKILVNDDFASLLSKYSQDFNVALAAGSISVCPKSAESMKQFVSKLSNDLNVIAKRVYKKEDETLKIIDDTLSELV